MKRAKVKLIFSALGLMVFVWSCNNSRPDDHAPIKDSNVNAVKQSPADTGANQELTGIYNDYVGRYKKPCIVDSVFSFGADTFRLHLRHYCLMDSAIKVPKKYVQIYKLDSFVTHNFATEIKLDRNNHTVFHGMVYKKDFDKYLYPQLKEYGALFCPEVNLSKDTIELDYSISIPLTDVGVGVAMILNRDGSVVYKAQ